ncbi:MAG: hypothetical protein EOP77_00775 [Variovorax sp.]|nr:MAG: hypothetical protein EOP77_00775 [Variovorax sp.]
MASPKHVLRCLKKIRIDGGSIDFNLHVLTLKAEPVDHFELMCEAIDQDIQSPAGVACVMDWIHRVEGGELDLAEVDGNAWVINITRDKVWFEGLYSQGEGGAVSTAQFKLAVQTYLRFLDDPEHKIVEVPFPDG